MRWLALALLAGCSLNRSAEREDSFAQQGETRTEAGPWTRETWEWAAPVLEDGGPGTSALAQEGPRAPVERRQSKPEVVGSIPTGGPLPGSVLRHVIETHAPVVSTSTTTVEASGEAKEARSARFGFAPWQWAIGGLVALAGLYGLWRLKARLGV